MMEGFIDPAASEGGRQGGGGFLSVYVAFWRKTEVIKLYLTNHCLAVCTTEVHRELDVSPRAVSTRVQLATCSLSIKTDSEPSGWASLGCTHTCTYTNSATTTSLAQRAAVCHMALSRANHPGTTGL